MNTDTPLDRGDRSIENVLRMLRPILEDKGIIGTVTKAKDLARICRNHHRRLPVREYRARDLADEINAITRCSGGLFVFDDLEIQVYYETDPGTRRRTASIEIQRLVSLEQQHLNSLKEATSTQEQL
jgi:hypothetical protein